MVFWSSWQRSTLCDLKMWHKNRRYFTSKPHIAASSRNTELANNISSTWKSYGFDTVKTVKYNVLLSFPTKNKTNAAFILDDKGGVKFETAQKEDIVDPSCDSPDATPPFSAYSPTGQETGEIVYANYGSRDDFEYLRSKNINCTDKIVLVRYGQVFRGDKVTNAANGGAKAVLIFNDPKDFAPVPDKDLYPDGWWLPRSGVQRGSVLLGTGDPLTPRYPAKEGVYRSKTAEIALPKIPAHPISARDAERFLSLMRGPAAPDSWQGGINVTYKLGPGFKIANWSVKVVTNNDHVRKDIVNVIAVIKGREEPDRLVLLGNHRDAWVFGGIDPSSGSSCMMELSKVLSQKVKKGWRPRRSIVLASWGGEEYGLLGSTEWVEDNIHTLYYRAVAYLNVDSPVRGNYTLLSWSSPLLHNVLYAAAKKTPDPVDKDRFVYDSWLERSPSPSGKTPRINPLGSGSDYAPFFLRTGVPSFDLRYMFNTREMYNVTTYPTYHSLFDTFNYVKKFVDPFFHTHLAVTKMWLTSVYLLAESPIIPFSLGDYVSVINGSVLKLKKDYGKQLDNQSISLEYLFKAVDKFSRGVKYMQTKIDNTQTNDTDALRTINDRLMGLEKTFLNPEGLPERPLYWHSIFAPSIFNSYASATFPGLSDALQLASRTGEWELVKTQLSHVIVAIEWAAQFMESTI
ncbi:N-acetylated-alpha-linked acidic dipeptidase 2-like isoform X2 [Actinia tenebrosa]|uniref:glutamate carboxypeptidase II n=1 Tax=Actinia tenebrosa TaxID=6105 RepID=A0A6P8HK75_ACTTE|nr:N-acetylated-alpha-linked acidic dipeptidase 2-like isoform X2 [Actinia tenebrosa]